MGKHQFKKQITKENLNMQNNITILFIVLMILSTVIIVTLLEVHLSKVVINKDIEMKHTIEVLSLIHI